MLDLPVVEQSYEPSISIQGVIYGGHIPKYDRKINVNNIKTKEKKKKKINSMFILCHETLANYIHSMTNNSIYTSGMH